MKERDLDLDAHKEYSATHLFIRSDERMQIVEADVANHSKAIESAQNSIKSVEERVNLGVARTGNENKTDIQDLKTRMALMERENGEMKKQLFDPNTGLVKQFDDSRGWQNNFSKNVTTFFIVQCAGALVLWAVKHFK